MIQPNRPNRPARRFIGEQIVHTSDERTGTVTVETDNMTGRWADGEWTYLVMFDHSDKLVRYAEHELTEAGR